MLSFLLIILCINIDALSYGIAYGFKRVKLKISYIFYVTILSTLFFAVPLYISKYIFQYFNPIICNIINGLILIIFGIYYFLQKSPDYKEKTSKKSHFEQNFDKKYILEKENTEKNNINKINNNYKKFNFKLFFIETLIISVDAIFTALLSGFSSNFTIFYIFFYAFSNFFAIFLGNFIFYKSNKFCKIKLSFFSGIIFIILGILKFFGI